MARAFARALALVSLAAWLSLSSQVLLLIGTRGLDPLGEQLERWHAAGLGVLDEPTLFWLAHGDALLWIGTVAGALLSVLALAGLNPRLCFALSAPLYLSYATAGGSSPRSSGTTC